MTQYNVASSQAEAQRESEFFTKDTYQNLLHEYSVEMDVILQQFFGLESNIPLDHRYFEIRNKAQYVRDKFTKE